MPDFNRRTNPIGGVDLSGSLYEQYVAQQNLAREFLRKGDTASAASAELRCAELYRQYAEYASNEEIYQKRLQIARQHQQNGEYLQAKRTPLPAHLPAPAPASAQQSDESALTQQVLGLIHRSNVTWDAIGGLQETKREIKLAYGMALARRPQGVKIRSLRNMLFYGPPGNGKTLLAAATSHGLHATFFSVKVSDLLSKYFGESTRLLSTLYSVAREKSPAVIFLDEFESLTPQRGGEESGAERRIVSTLLAELDGLASKDDESLVLTIAATNLPWQIDKAVMSRFEKKIYIPQPDHETRAAILHIQTVQQGHQLDLPLESLVMRTEGYSGREIEQLCKEAIKLMTDSANPGLEQAVDKGTAGNYQMQVVALSSEHFDPAFLKVLPKTTASDLQRFADWQQSD